jgi:hypothetical protein
MHWIFFFAGYPANPKSWIPDILLGKLPSLNLIEEKIT